MTVGTSNSQKNVKLFDGHIDLRTKKISRNFFSVLRILAIFATAHKRIEFAYTNTYASVGDTEEYIF